jgi:hypothetical protein
VNIKNAKNGVKMQKICSKQDKGLNCEKTKLIGAKTEKPGPNRKDL